MPLAAHLLESVLGDWRSGPGPAYLRLAGALADRILDGRLPAGTRLPAERSAAASVGMSRRTVASAYSTLRERGLVASRQGSGNYVRGPARTEAPGGMPWAPAAAPAEPAAVDLALAAPMRPPAVVAAALVNAAASVSTLTSPGYVASGLPELREAVARRYSDHGVPTSSRQILITNGAHQALDIVLRRIGRPGDVAIVEDPTYPAALDSLRARRARVAVTALAEGWDLDELESMIHRHHPAVVYLVPDYQMPTGLLMSDEQRAQLVRRTAGTTLIVDESLYDLGFGAGSATPVAAYDDFRHVVSIGSISKSYWGGLRIGWIRASTDLANELAHLKAATDLSCPYVEQRAAAELLARIDQDLPAWRAELARRRDALCDALEARFPAWAVPRPDGGVVVWARTNSLPTDALARNAARFGLRLVGGSRFSAVGGSEDRLRLPFTLEPDELRRGVDHLASLVSWWTEHGRHESPLAAELTLAV